jgi:hypothetical protein
MRTTENAFHFIVHQSTDNDSHQFSHQTVTQFTPTTISLPTVSTTATRRLGLGSELPSLLFKSLRYIISS